MAKPRLEKVRALFYVLQQLTKIGCANFDTASLIFIFDFAPEGIEICLSIVQPSILVLSHGQEENPEDNVLPAQSV